MATPYDELISFVMESGISEAEARHAVRQCALSMAKTGLAGYAAGGAVSYFMAMNPATAVPYAVGGMSLGAGYALAKNPACQEVRDAVRYWSTASF